DAQQEEQVCRLKQSQCQFFGYDLIEIGQEQGGQHDGQQTCQKSQQGGFADKLADQTSTACTDYLFDSDLFGSFLRACRGQVHEIDTGDDQHDPGHHGEEPHIFDAALYLIAVLVKGIVQMPAFHGIEPQ